MNKFFDSLKTNWRKWLRSIHRDVGYLSVGLTVAYAISGIAVNHVDEWNPNYVTEQIKSKIILPSNVESLSDDELTKLVLAELKINDEVKSTFRPEPHLFQLFLDGNTISVNLNTGDSQQEIVSNRTFLREVNFLHLNHAKKVWTYVADLFAVALSFLALSGLFMIKGKDGISGRGAWLAAMGLLIPIIFLLIYFN